MVAGPVEGNALCMGGDGAAANTGKKSRLMKKSIFD